MTNAESAPRQSGEPNRRKNPIRMLAHALRRGDLVQPPTEGRPDAQSPDGAYAQVDLVRHPVTGEMIPVRELLDDAHAAVRARELIRQDQEPRPETSPLRAEEVPGLAFELLMNLQDSVRAWQPSREEPSDRGIVRTYSHSEFQGSEDVVPGKVFYTIQLSYKDAESDTPTYGNLSITRRTDSNWMREYYFQASPLPAQDGRPPSIYYDDYPYHEEELGRPEQNTVAAYQAAKDLIDQVPAVCL